MDRLASSCSLANRHFLHMVNSVLRQFLPHGLSAAKGRVCRLMAHFPARFQAVHEIENWTASGNGHSHGSANFGLTAHSFFSSFGESKLLVKDREAIMNLPARGHVSVAGQLSS